MLKKAVIYLGIFIFLLNIFVLASVYDTADQVTIRGYCVSPANSSYPCPANDIFNRACATSNTCGYNFYNEINPAFARYEGDFYLAGNSTCYLGGSTVAADQLVFSINYSVRPPDPASCVSDGVCVEACVPVDIDCCIADGVCFRGCGALDPDCCFISEASWDLSCVGNGQEASLTATGDDNCPNTEVTVEVHENDEGLIDEFTATFEDDVLTTSWIAKYVDDGALQGNPEYEFVIVSPYSNSITSSNQLEVEPCELAIDIDCDGVVDATDLCGYTPYCSSTNAEGCTTVQAGCIAEWDCSAALWSECDEETNLMTRDISKCIFTGDPSGPCYYDFRPPATRYCVLEEEFPFFTITSLIITVSILVLFYLRKILKNGK